MSAVFNFQSLLVVILLIICTCAYVRSMYPSILDRNKNGFLGLFWKAARIGKLSKLSVSYQNLFAENPEACTYKSLTNRVSHHRSPTNRVPCICAFRRAIEPLGLYGLCGYGYCFVDWQLAIERNCCFL